ncbi:MAG: glycosyltransferase family 4 protein [Stellaceae bacterium]
MISNIFPPGFMGGYELGALDVARALIARGNIVRVLTSDYFLDDAGTLAGVEVTRVLECLVPGRLALTSAEQTRRGWIIDVRGLRRVGSELIAFLPDVIVAYNLIGIGPIGLLQYLVAIGMVPVLHLMDDLFHIRRFAPEVSESARRIFGTIDFLDNVEMIVMSRRLQSDVEQTLGYKLPDMTLVPGWVDPTLAPETITARKPCAQEQFRFVFSSRIVSHKGIDLALEAARSLVEAGHENFRLDIYGAGESAALVQQVIAFGLADRVCYRGILPKSEMTRRLGDYDALLFATMEREPFGFVVAEAAAAGCIPVVTNGIGAAEWFFDGIDCLKIQRTATDLAAAMRRLLLMPASERQEMRHRAWKTAHLYLDFGRALSTIEKVIQRAAARSGPVVPQRVRACEAALTLLDDMCRLTDSA